MFDIENTKKMNYGKEMRTTDVMGGEFIFLNE